MKLSTIEIKNFRGITQLTIDLDATTTVLIGENNIGKTTVLEAIRFCLGRSLVRKGSPFNEYDYHLTNTTKQPSDAPPIELLMTFKEGRVDEWSDGVVQSLGDAVQVGVDQLQVVKFRLRSKYAPDAKEFTTEWDFLNLVGDPLPKAKNPRNVIALQQVAPLFYLAALRDAAQEFRAQSQFWGPFLRNLTLEDDVRVELETALAELNQKVVDAHTALGTVKERLGESKGIVPLHQDEPVSIEALPGRVFDLLSRAQVMLKNKLGTRLPLGRHGEGTQSLAVVLLFDAFLRTRLTEGYHADAEPILALEEPEAHLHPSAIWSLAGLLSEIPGQKVIATHSGDLLASVPLTSIRRLRRQNNEIKVFDVLAAGLSPRDVQKIEYHVRIRRGSLLFARCWLLVEGETDFWLLPALAKCLESDLGREGVSCVEFSQCGADALIKCAKALGIEWHCLADGDQAGNDYVATAGQHLGTDAAPTRITQLVEPFIEHCLWAHGYHGIYENAVSPARRALITVPNANPQYPAQVIEAAIRSSSKPALAQEVIAAAEARGAAGVPQRLRAAIEAAVLLARSAA